MIADNKMKKNKDNWKSLLIGSCCTSGGSSAKILGVQNFG